MSLNQVGSRARVVPPIVRGALLLAAAGMATFWIVTASGPFLWLANWQMRSMGSYSVTLTGLLVVVFALLPAGIVVQLLARTVFASRAVAATPSRSPQEVEALIRRYRFVVAAIAVGAILASIGIFEFARVVLYGEHTEYAPGQAPWPPPSRWLALTAQPEWNTALTYEEDVNGSRTETDYIALRPYVGGTASAPVQLVAKVTEFRRDDVHSATIDGTIDGMPSALLRDAFARRGVVLAADARIFTVGHTPAQSRENGLIFTTTGGGFLLVGAALWAWVRRKRA